MIKVAASVFFMCVLSVASADSGSIKTTDHESSTSLNSTSIQSAKDSGAMPSTDTPLLGKDAGKGDAPIFDKWLAKALDDPVELFTFVLAIFTALLWWSTNKLWKEAKDAGEVARMSAEAAKAAAEVARDSANAYISSERAWLSINAIPCERFEDSYMDGGGEKVNGYSFHMQWSNQGRTPAVKVKLIIRGIVSEPESPIPEMNRLADTKGNFVSSSVFPNTTVRSGSFPMSDEILDRLAKRKVKFYLYGYVEYEDIFHAGILRQTEVMAEVVSSGIRADSGMRNFTFAMVGSQNTAT